MTDEDRVILTTLSVLLQYPREESVPDLAGQMASVPWAKEFLENFLRYRRETPLLRLQEEYTRTFDLDPSTSLHLTFHRSGTPPGGNALQDLHAVYKNAGWENVTRELPDYLPMVLEFLTICPEQDAAWISREYGKTVSLLASRLKERGSPYAGLLRAAAGLLGDSGDGGEDGSL